MIRITYFGVEGEGRTVKLAKEDAGRRIEQAMKNSARTWIWRGMVLVVMPTAYGSSYILTGPDDSEGEKQSSSSCITFEDGVLSGLRHMFHNGRTMGEVRPPDFMARAMGRDAFRQTCEDARSLDAFHRAYKAAPFTEDGAKHNWACQHQHEFALSD